MALSLGIASAAACGRGFEPATWLWGDAAEIRCVDASIEGEPRGLLGALPLAPLPAWLMVGGFGRAELAELGFSGTVCVARWAPSTAELIALERGLAALAAERTALGLALDELAPGCGCELAHAVGPARRALVPGCEGRPLRAACPVEPALVERARERTERVVALLGATPVPLARWRIVGRGRRPRWLGPRVHAPFDRYPGASERLIPGRARTDDPFEVALLGRPDVAGLIRFDDGRGWLALRIVAGGGLVYDAWRWPDDSRPEPSWWPLWAPVAAAAVPEQLAPPSPSQRGSTAVGAALGVWGDRHAEARIEALAAAWAGRRREPACASAAVDRVELAAGPRGGLLTLRGDPSARIRPRDGAELDLRVVLGELARGARRPAGGDAARCDDPRWAALWWLWGWLDALDRTGSGRLEGRADRFTVRFGPGPVAVGLATPPSLDRLRQWASRHALTLEVEGAIGQAAEVTARVRW